MLLQSLKVAAIVPPPPQVHAVVMDLEASTAVASTLSCILILYCCHRTASPRQVHAVVMDLEASMAEVGVNQRHANQGIYVLCKAVSELMAGSNIPSKVELIEYTQQHPVWASASEQRLQGLESLLPASGPGPAGLRRVQSSSAAGGARGRDENVGPERHAAGPFLLGSAGSGGRPPVAPMPRKTASVSDAAPPAVMSYGLPPVGVSYAVTHPSSVEVGGAGSGSGGMFGDSGW